MRLDRNAVRTRLEAGDLHSLFVEDLGWDRARGSHQIDIEGVSVTATEIADKRGFRAFGVQAPEELGTLPPSARRAVRDRLAGIARENLIVFLSSNGNEQTWQWTRREIARPLAMREHSYHVGQTGEALIQKLDHLVVTFQEEDEGITIFDVTDRARRAFDADAPSRRFYDRFRDERDAFVARIDGLESETDRSWYGSVMLNRLMFVYFVQQKGFLDDDRDYLRTRLRMVRESAGPDQFHGFYREFLLRLFFDGLGSREIARDAETRRLIGDVPYLNGGMFVPHHLERQYDIEIPDAAFEAVLSFFEEFTWHLDGRPVQRDNEINPDVLGYIFERYINQKAKGAYYTKEDVTEYIARATVLPRLLDLVEAQAPNSFGGAGAVWRHLQEDPDRYLFRSMTVGLDDVNTQSGLERTNDDGFEAAEKSWFDEAEGTGLPRETWAGRADRLNRANNVRALLSAGEVRSADALVTHNLDARQFVQDIIERTDDPALLDAFHTALKGISILDPTCGSGAFLFAVLNMLEPIYESVLDRMQAFSDDAERTGWGWNQELRGRFEAALTEAASHRNRGYYVLRTIVVNNLFGVDIMDEAVEICKLRLFLKLASQLDERADVEPLPDIDFNVRSGNALVGYTRHPTMGADGLDLSHTRDELEQQVARLDEQSNSYRTIQFGDRAEAAALKSDIVDRIGALDDTLNRSLAERYSATSARRLEAWQSSHQPFHWWAAFYEQMNRGGFDVIVGNPPYIPKSEVQNEYTVLDLETEKASDIYAWVMERCVDLLAPGARSGMIVPLSLTFSSRFTTLRDVLPREYAVNWYSSFGRIPSALFNYDVRVRNTIHVGRRRAAGERASRSLTGRLHRWFEEERPFLLETLSFQEYDPKLWDGLVPKVHTPALLEFFQEARRRSVPTIESVLRRQATGHTLHFKKSAYNWLNFCQTIPPCYDREGRLIKQTEYGDVHFATKNDRDLSFLLLNGKWQFAYWYLIGDDFHVTGTMFKGLPAPFSRLSAQQRGEALALVPELEDAMVQATSFKLNAGKRVGNYNLARCRHVTDRSDALFARAFGWEAAWPDVQLLYAQAVKTTYDTGDETGDDND